MSLVRNVFWDRPGALLSKKEKSGGSGSLKAD